MAKKPSLDRYQQRRDFRRTPERSGTSRRRRAKKPVFAVQEHDARNLHYDFRLETRPMSKSAISLTWVTTTIKQTAPPVLLT